MSGLSCALILLGTNGITTAESSTRSFQGDLAQRPNNLRRSLESKSQLLQHLPVGDNLRAANANHRSLENETTSKLKNIDKELSGKDNSNEDNETSESETAKLENIEKEFSGEGNNNNNEENGTSENETENHENTPFDGENGNNKKVESGISNEEESMPTAKESEANDKTEEVESETKPETKKESVTAFPTEAPEPETVAPTMKPTETPYTKDDDGFDPIKAIHESEAEEEEVQELETELKQEEKVARQAGGLGIFFGILAMVFTAHQMSENPDGIYASVCRLAITISTVVVKIICMPCRKVLGLGGTGGNPYSGHMPISTSDYSYRNDPYRSSANAGFEMS